MIPPIPEKLGKTLLEIDGKGYKAYKKLQGTEWSYEPFTVKFEHVQGDPFAQPSRVSVTVNMTEAGFTKKFYDTPTRRLALEDFLLRAFHEEVRKNKTRIRGTGKSGLITAQIPSQKILKRNAALVEGETLRLIMFAGLPADGRKILGGECERLFSEVLPTVWSGALLAASLDLRQLENHIETLEDYVDLQSQLEKNDWSAFVANGSLLPRLSGNSDLPLGKSGVEFAAPDDFSETIKLPHKGVVIGMAIPKGITLVVGGGFHGKSTLLRAVQDAVYPHIPGDGREMAATLPSAVKVRAEDGRAVTDVDISAFMDELPSVKDTKKFSTQSASGSTSQAVNIIESIESGTQLLLMDEDTCATNFMIRDSRMQALVHSEKEPITPLVDRIEEIYSSKGVSVIMVMGGSGDYFESAHHVIAMEWFKPRLVTREAKEIAEANPTGRKKETTFPIPEICERRVSPKALSFDKGKKECVVQAYGLDALVMGRKEVDVRYVEQLVEEGQLEMCGWILRRWKNLQVEERTTNVEGIKKIFAEIEKDVNALTPYNTGLLALPRIHEVLAVVNRIRAT